MPKYHCHGAVVGGKYLGVVEAADEEEAKEKEKALALEGAYISICCQCSRECEDAEIDEVIVSEVEDGEEGE